MEVPLFDGSMQQQLFVLSELHDSNSMRQKPFLKGALRINVPFFLIIIIIPEKNSVFQSKREEVFVFWESGSGKKNKNLSPEICSSWCFYVSMCEMHFFYPSQRIKMHLCLDLF